MSRQNYGDANTTNYSDHVPFHNPAQQQRPALVNYWLTPDTYDPGSWPCNVGNLLSTCPYESPSYPGPGTYQHVMSTQHHDDYSQVQNGHTQSVNPALLQVCDESRKEASGRIISSQQRQEAVTDMSKTASPETLNIAGDLFEIVGRVCLHTTRFGNRNLPSSQIEFKKDGVRVDITLLMGDAGDQDSGPSPQSKSPAPPLEDMLQAYVDRALKNPGTYKISISRDEDSTRMSIQHTSME
mgnify:FL=1